MISLKRLSKLYKIDRSDLHKLIKKLGIVSEKVLIADRMQTCISDKDSKTLIKNKFSSSPAIKISASEVFLTDVSIELRIDRRNIAHHLKTLGIKKFKRYGGSTRKTQWAIKGRDFKKLRDYRLFTSNKITRELI